MIKSLEYLQHLCSFVLLNLNIFLVNLQIQIDHYTLLIVFWFGLRDLQNSFLEDFIMQKAVEWDIMQKTLYYVSVKSDSVQY